MFLNRTSTSNYSGEVFAESTLGQDNGINIALLEAELVYKDMVIRTMELEHQFLSEGAEDRMEALEESFMDKAKDFFKKLWETIKAFFQRVYMWFEQLLSKKSSYIKKHTLDINKGIDRLNDEEDSYEGLSNTQLSSLNAMAAAAIDKTADTLKDNATNLNDSKTQDEFEVNINAMNDTFDTNTETSEQSGSDIKKIATAGITWFGSTVYKGQAKIKQAEKAYEKELKEAEKKGKLIAGQYYQNDGSFAPSGTGDFNNSDKGTVDAKVIELNTKYGAGSVEKATDKIKVAVGKSTRILGIRRGLRYISLAMSAWKKCDSEYWKAIKKAMSKTQRINKFSDKAKYESTDLLGEFGF
jgi:hypothetical protein